MNKNDLRALIGRLRHRTIYSRTAGERAYWRRSLMRNRAKLKPQTISSRGVDFIKEFEGFYPRPYRDPVGVWTIGYGSTKGVGPNSPGITEKQATARLRRELEERYVPPVRALTRSTGRALKQHEFDALVSAVYNLGPGVLEPRRSLGAALRARTLWRTRTARALKLYDKAGGRALPGLTRRRAREARLFLMGSYR